MIEIPRAALVADEIAKDAEFFSFGTNDLTQTTLGMSRDDSGSFPPRLCRAGHRSEQSLRLDRPKRRRPPDGNHARPRPQNAAEDQARHLRRTRRRPISVKFCHRLGLNYVSCSPFRVPIAKLAAAQAALGA